MQKLTVMCGLLCLLTACEKSPSPQAPAVGASGDKLRVVVTTGMVGDLVRHVVGDQAEVIGLMGEGIDPHLYRPTGQDIQTLMGADVIFYSGLMLEGRLQSSLEKAGNGKRVVQAVTADLPKEKLLFPAQFEGHPDPHVWGDVALWVQCLDPVVKVLSEQRPQHAAEFQQRAEAYRQELLQLDAESRAALASIPAESRVLVTAHDAFSYFARAYGVEERAVQGITTESEAGTRDINELVTLLVERRIPALFVEATVNSANLKAVIEGAQHQNWKVAIGGMLYSDSMGGPGTYEGTYQGMVDHNVTTITRALGGQVPETGLRGKLTITPTAH